MEEPAPVEDDELLIDLPNEGTCVPCSFSDDEEDDEKHFACPICSQSRGQNDFILQLRGMFEQLLGRLGRETIYDVLAKVYEQEYRKSMALGGKTVPVLSREAIKLHFEKHEQSQLADVVYDLTTIQMVQRELREHGIRLRHTTTNATKIDVQKVKLYLDLSKQKVALHKCLKRLHEENPKANAKRSATQFFSETW